MSFLCVREYYYLTLYQVQRQFSMKLDVEGVCVKAHTHIYRFA